MKKYRYPFLDLRKVNSPIMAELKDAAWRVIESGRYIGGDEVERLTERLSSLTGRKHCVAVSNGLDALRLTLRAYVETGQIEPGKEVIVPANSYIASALAIADAGLRPVFVSPDSRTMLADSACIRNAIGPKTAAVMPVDLYGRVWDDEVLLGELKDEGIITVEDAAQAIGARSAKGHNAGGTGNAAAFSFYPTKNIGALGDAGAVVTDDAKIAATVRALSNYGQTEQYKNRLAGYNCRMDPIQAAMLCVKLDRLEEENNARRRNAAVYASRISNPAIILPPDEPGMIYHQYVVTIDGDRDKFRAYMAENGVETAVHYPVPIDRQPCMRRYAAVALDDVEIMANSIVSLPISQATSADDAAEIAEIANGFMM